MPRSRRAVKVRQLQRNSPLQMAGFRVARRQGAPGSAMSVGHSAAALGVRPYQVITVTWWASRQAVTSPASTPCDALEPKCAKRLRRRDGGQLLTMTYGQGE